MHQNEKRKSATKEYLSFNNHSVKLSAIVNIFEPITAWYLADYHGEAESKTVFMARICRDMSEFALLTGLLSKRKSSSILWGLLRSFSLGPPLHASIKSEPKFCSYIPNCYLVHAISRPLFLCAATNKDYTMCADVFIDAYIYEYHHT